MSSDPFTDALHADDALASFPDVAPPLRPTTTYERIEGGRTYRRESDETTERLEAVLGALDGGHSVFYPSGMAAVDAVLAQLSPDRIALPTDVYHGVRILVTEGAQRGRWAIVEPDQLGPGDVRWVETPSNPKCLITDIEAVTAAARARGVVTVVDATFATPVLQQTLALGADFAIHATTKFIAGHSDAMGGVVSTTDEASATALRESRTITGAVPGALETWLTLRGIRTLPLRVLRQSASAATIAAGIRGVVAKVWYPGLDDHEGHVVARRQMEAFGGMLSFEVDTAEEAAMLVSRLQVFKNATSLGGVESLAEHRLLSDASAPPGLIRLSVGLEDPAALLADLRQAIG